MEHVRTLQRFWNWLPAFRAVAETPHLPTASGRIFVTPSALSRTIRLLEEEVGQPLFVRQGRSLELAPGGQVLLTAVRDAMRRVHEGLLEVQAVRHRGPIHISVAGPLAPSLVLPALQQLASDYPRLVPHIHSVTGGAAVNEGLRRGALDIALTEDPLLDPELHLERILTVTHQVYAAPSHPIWSREDREQALAEASFAAPVADEDGQTPDAWPLERPRQVALRVTQMQVAIEAVLTGGYVAVLPELVARRFALRSLEVEGIEPTALYMVHRPSLVEQGRTEVVVEALRQVWAQL